MSKKMRQAIAMGKKLADEQRDEPCPACGGSGRYDAADSPKCGACNGTGRQVKQQRSDLREVCVECHWWTGANHHEYGICRVTTSKCARLHPCDCGRFEREQDA